MNTAKQTAVTKKHDQYMVSPRTMPTATFTVILCVRANIVRR